MLFSFVFYLKISYKYHNRYTLRGEISLNILDYLSFETFASSFGSVGPTYVFGDKVPYPN